jgi:ankyrin repeat protein
MRSQRRKELGVRLANALRDRNFKVARELLSRGADPNARASRDSWPPLAYAALSGPLDLVSALLAAGARVNGGGIDGCVLHIAISNARLDVAKVLLEAGANPNKPRSDGSTPLMRAVLQGDVTFIRYILEVGADVNARDHDGNSALLVAAMNRKGKVQKLFLDVGASQRVTNRWGLSYRKLSSGRPIPKWLKM